MQKPASSPTQVIAAMEHWPRSLKHSNKLSSLAMLSQCPSSSLAKCGKQAIVFSLAKTFETDVRNNPLISSQFNIGCNLSSLAVWIWQCVCQCRHLKAQSIGKLNKKQQCKKHDWLLAGKWEKVENWKRWVWELPMTGTCSAGGCNVANCADWVCKMKIFDRFSLLLDAKTCLQPHTSHSSHGALAREFEAQQQAIQPCHARATQHEQCW